MRRSCLVLLVAVALSAVAGCTRANSGDASSTTYPAQILPQHAASAAYSNVTTVGTVLLRFGRHQNFNRIFPQDSKATDDLAGVSMAQHLVRSPLGSSKTGIVSVGVISKRVVVLEDFDAVSRMCVGLAVVAGRSRTPAWLAGHRLPGRPGLYRFSALPASGSCASTGHDRLTLVRGQYFRVSKARAT